MEITSVEPQKSNPGRFNIFLDGKFAFGADEDLVVNHRLIKGKQIDQEFLEKLLFEAEVGKLMERMYRLFNIRQRSEKEVKDYLKNLTFKRRIKGKEEISELVIERLVETLKQKGMLNDELFAKSWAQARRRSKKKGQLAIRAELFQKGIDREVIDEITKSDPEEEFKLAQDAVARKIQVWKLFPFLEMQKKIIGFLLRKGFDYSVAKRVVESVSRKA